MQTRERKIPKKKYLRPKEVAEMMDRSEGTLANDRLYRRGLPYVKLRGQILYDIEDIISFMDAKKVRFE